MRANIGGEKNTSQPNTNTQTQAGSRHTQTHARTHARGDIIQSQPKTTFSRFSLSQSAVDRADISCNYQRSRFNSWSCSSFPHQVLLHSFSFRFKSSDKLSTADNRRIGVGIVSQGRVGSRHVESQVRAGRNYLILSDSRFSDSLSLSLSLSL